MKIFSRVNFCYLLNKLIKLTAPKLIPGLLIVRLNKILANDDTTQELIYIAVNSSGDISPHGWMMPRFSNISFKQI